jgi:hypothetical protein
MIETSDECTVTMPVSIAVQPEAPVAVTIYIPPALVVMPAVVAPVLQI